MERSPRRSEDRWLRRVLVCAPPSEPELARPATTAPMSSSLISALVSTCANNLGSRQNARAWTWARTGVCTYEVGCAWRLAMAARWRQHGGHLPNVRAGQSFAPCLKERETFQPFAMTHTDTQSRAREHALSASHTGSLSLSRAHTHMRIPPNPVPLRETSGRYLPDQGTCAASQRARERQNVAIQTIQTMPSSSSFSTPPPLPLRLLAPDLPRAASSGRPRPEANFQDSAQ